jgi:hypothetical protein
MAFGDGNTRKDDYDTIQYAETDDKITVRFRAWHLNPSLANSSGADIYFAVVDSSNAFADAGTVSRTTFPDFDINQGDLRLVFKGYVTNQGDTSGAVATSTATKFTPYWEVSKEIIPREDYFDDGDKDFEIKLYTSSADRNALEDTYEGDALEFNLKDNSGPIYQFNTVRGYGTSDSSGINATGGTASLSEGFLYSFRIETTNVAGTRLWYSMSGGRGVEEDFEPAFPGYKYGQHPGPPTGYRPIRDSYYSRGSGELETFAPNAEIDRVSDKYGNLIAGGTNLDRSIAFIFIKPKEDYVTEGTENYIIYVYNDYSERDEYLVATVTVNIFPSSAPAAPTITLTCDPISVNSGDLYTVKWVVSNVSEDNLKDEKENDNRIIGGPGIGDITSANLTSNSSVSVTSYSNAREGGKTVHNYSATVYNKAGKSVNDTASVTVNVPHIYGCMDPTATNYNYRATAEYTPSTCEYPPPIVRGCTDPSYDNYNPDANENDGSCANVPVVVVPPVAKKYRVYPLWRWRRRGSNYMARFVFDTTGSDDFQTYPTSPPKTSPDFSNNHEPYGYQAFPAGAPEYWMGGVFLSNDRPSGTKSLTDITYGNLLDGDHGPRYSQFYVFDTNTGGGMAAKTKKCHLYIRDPDYSYKNKGTIGDRYHFRGVGEGWDGNSITRGWKKGNIANNFYFADAFNKEGGVWYWYDPR